MIFFIPHNLRHSHFACYVYECKEIQKYKGKLPGIDIDFEGWKYQKREIPKKKWQLETIANNKVILDAIVLSLTELYEISLGG